MKFAVLGLLATLAGCGGIVTGEALDRDFWFENEQGQASSQATALGLADLTRGEFAGAEVQFTAALRQYPTDVYALMGLGMVYEKTARPSRARSMYEAVLAARPPDAVLFMAGANGDPRPIGDAANVRLARIDGDPDMTAAASAAPRATQAAAAPPPPAVVPASTSPVQPVRAATSSRYMPTKAMVDEYAALTPEDRMAVSRFEILKMLLDEGLLTPAEYGVRRQANTGALLPLSQPRPAAGLERPVPSGEQIASRLRSLARAHEMGAVNVGQHTAERTIILDALLPAKVRLRAAALAPPKGLLEAADAIRRLEWLKRAALISENEYARERGAIGTGLEPKTVAGAAPLVSGTPAALVAAGGPLAAATPASTAPRMGLHLASFKSESAAKTAWRRLVVKHGDVLGDLAPSVVRADIPRKGVYYRLIAGPLGSKADAARQCRKLKSKRQYCAPMAGS